MLALIYPRIAAYAQISSYARITLIKPTCVLLKERADDAHDGSLRLNGCPTHLSPLKEVVVHVEQRELLL